jgi:hypothetical protein
MEPEDYVDLVFDLVGRVLYITAFAAAMYVAGKYGPAFGQALFG